MIGGCRDDKVANLIVAHCILLSCCIFLFKPSNLNNYLEYLFNLCYLPQIASASSGPLFCVRSSESRNQWAHIKILVTRQHILKLILRGVITKHCHNITLVYLYWEHLVLIIIIYSLTLYSLGM